MDPLKANSDRAKNALKQERDRQKMQKAQKTLLSLRSPASKAIKTIHPLNPSNLFRPAPADLLSRPRYEYPFWLIR
jgi:hypothetical protein